MRYKAEALREQKHAHLRPPSPAFDDFCVHACITLIMSAIDASQAAYEIFNEMRISIDSEGSVPHYNNLI